MQSIPVCLSRGPNRRRDGREDRRGEDMRPPARTGRCQPPAAGPTREDAGRARRATWDRRARRRAVDHAIFDKRRYPVVGVPEGYAAWAPTYERTAPDEMDLRLLGRLRTVDWSAARRVLDLACGTGRVGAWLRARSAATIDGVDLTPEMLERARRRDVYRGLSVADVCATGLPGG